MTENIQKSSQLIKFSDSVFDERISINNNNDNEQSEYSDFSCHLEMLKFSASCKENNKEMSALSEIKKLFAFKIEKRKVKKAEEKQFIANESKILKFEDLLKIYFEIENLNEETEISEIICTYGPMLLFRTCEEFKENVLKELKRLGDIKKICFGQVFIDRSINMKKIDKLINCLDFYFKAEVTNDCSNNFKNNYYANGDKNNIDANFIVIDDVYIVQGRKLKNFLKLDNLRFSAKEICELFSILEAQEFLKQDNLEMFAVVYGCKCTDLSTCKSHSHSKNTNNINDLDKKNDFVSVYNRLTNILISKILEKNSKEARAVIVQRILKLTKHFSRMGAMNSLKACMAALQSNSIHRLNVIKEQGIKYQKRFEEMSHVTSSQNNFDVFRRREFLVPWMGIIMKDFTFIKEIYSYKINNNSKNVNCKDNANLVHLPLAMCLRKLINSVVIARMFCREFVAKQKNLNKLKEVAVGHKWLMTCEILYESEEAQYERSEKLL